MSKIEEMLNNKKIEVEELEIPDELEGRLRGALEKTESPKKRRYAWTTKVASLIIAALLIGYNSDTLAFYGRKIMGFDEIMTDTLKNLNELGKGQVIDKSYTFKNGVKVTLDGIMLDDNQLLMFYTVKDPKGNVDEKNLTHVQHVKGLIGTYYMGSGMGKRNEENTEIRWNVEFEKPYLFEKSLEWRFGLTEENVMEEGKISFTLDRSKAMGSSLKKRLNKSIEVDQGKITFDSIVASPTTTYIEGKMQNIFQLAKDEFSGEGFRPTGLDIRLIANGKEVQKQGGGMSTNMKGITFDNKFDALPKELKTLQIKVISLQTNNKVDKKLELSIDKKGEEIEILGQDIKINNVYKKEGKTYVTITTKEEVALSEVYLLVNGKSVELKETTENGYDKKTDGTINYTRTLCFEEAGEELTLQIKGIRYNKVYNKVIDVEV